LSIKLNNSIVNIINYYSIIRLGKNDQENLLLMEGMNFYNLVTPRDQCIQGCKNE